MFVREVLTVDAKVKFMMKLTENTILELLDAFAFTSHADIEEFVIRFGIKDGDNRGSMSPRKLGLVAYLFNNPDRTGPLGSNVVSEMVQFLVERHHVENASDRYPRLVRSLERNGYTIENGRLQTMLPGNLEIAETENELSSMLTQFGFGVPKGHFDQAIAAHTRGAWAAANSQLRSFIESLFDSIADAVNNGKTTLPGSSHARREWLATVQPPFLLAALNEWEVGGTKGFVQGFWYRLHPQGSHPGLSDEEDSTFRLYMVIIVASHFLRRLIVYTKSQP